nr:MAG TPA: hypothetical protein [Caudoviricetes sp.]
MLSSLFRFGGQPVATPVPKILFLVVECAVRVEGFQHHFRMGHLRIGVILWVFQDSAMNLGCSDFQAFLSLGEQAQQILHFRIIRGCGHEPFIMHVIEALPFNADCETAGQFFGAVGVVKPSFECHMGNQPLANFFIEPPIAENINRGGVFIQDFEAVEVFTLKNFTDQALDGGRCLILVLCLHDGPP